MTDTPFFRLLKTPIEAKGQALAAQIAALNSAALNAAGSPLPQEGEVPEPVLSEAEGVRGETFTRDPAAFALIPGSPFAYWVSDYIRQLFTQLPSLDEQGDVKQGIATANDFRFVRAWWEVAPGIVVWGRIGTQPEEIRSQTIEGRRWVPFAKGGKYSQFYADIHLVVNWEHDGKEIRSFVDPTTGRLRSRPQNVEFYFRPGLTWSDRTTRMFSARAWPLGGIFSVKGSAGFFPGRELYVLALMNALIFNRFLSLMVGAGDAAARSYQVGTIGNVPFPDPVHGTKQKSKGLLSTLANEAHDLERDRDRTDEATHAFCLPGLVRHQMPGSLLEASLALEAADQAAQARLAAIQAEIDDLAFDLYGLDESDRALVRAEMGDEPPDTDDDKEQDEEPAPPEDLPARVQNLLMWCLGVAFGRWDVRMALDPTLLPALQGPFDPLPRCAPGALVGSDGLPPTASSDIAPEAWLRARQNVLDTPPSPWQGEGPEPVLSEAEGVRVEYPLPVAWDGILVDDPTHPSDIVTRVQGVLALLWGDAAGAIEREACAVLGFKSLRDYFRDPRKGFFAFHIKRYSKSRRKAPIYWLLQSERRNYAVWLYLHRMDRASLYAAGRNYVDAKLKLEQLRLEEFKQDLAGLEGGARRRREREVERQSKMVAEVAAFRKRLDAAALRNLPPDLNDGVVIGIAPLWELVPWKEAQKTWEKLVAGEYEWSTMARRMRERGLVNRKS